MRKSSNGKLLRIVRTRRTRADDTRTYNPRGFPLENPTSKRAKLRVLRVQRVLMFLNFRKLKPIHSESYNTLRNNLQVIVEVVHITHNRRISIDLLFHFDEVLSNRKYSYLTPLSLPKSIQLMGTSYLLTDYLRTKF